MRRNEAQKDHDSRGPRSFALQDRRWSRRSLRRREKASRFRRPKARSRESLQDLLGTFRKRSHAYETRILGRTERIGLRTSDVQARHWTQVTFRPILFERRSPSILHPRSSTSAGLGSLRDGESRV